MHKTSSIIVHHAYAVFLALMLGLTAVHAAQAGSAAYIADAGAETVPACHAVPDACTAPDCFARCLVRGSEIAHQDAAV